MTDTPTEPEVHVGALCSHGGNRLPMYRVIAIYDGKAWLRDVNNGVDGVVELAHCHRVVEDKPVAEDAPAHTAPPTGPSSEPPKATPIPE